RRPRRAPPRFRNQGAGSNGHDRHDPRFGLDRRVSEALRPTNPSSRGANNMEGTQMTARMYYDDDTDPSALAGQTVAIIGYGSQGHAHALNLHESGVKVIVGLAPGSKSRTLAEEAGLEVADVGEAVRKADVIMIALP